MYELRVNQQQSIITVHEQGSSGRRIGIWQLIQKRPPTYKSAPLKSACQNRQLTHKLARSAFLVLPVCVIRGGSRSKRRWSGVCPIQRIYQEKLQICGDCGDMVHPTTDDTNGHDFWLGASQGQATDVDAKNWFCWALQVVKALTGRKY